EERLEFINAPGRFHVRQNRACDNGRREKPAAPSGAAGVVGPKLQLGRSKTGATGACRRAALVTLGAMPATTEPTESAEGGEAALALHDRSQVPIYRERRDVVALLEAGEIRPDVHVRTD